MKRENNKLYALTLLISAPAWIALLAAKGRGSVGINWPTAILGGRLDPGAGAGGPSGAHRRARPAP